MKKSIKLASIIAAAMATACALTVASGAARERYQWGDINGSGGTANTADLVRLMKHLSGTDVVTYHPDLNVDGTIDTKDLVRLMKFISGAEVETINYDTLGETENPAGEEYTPVEPVPAAEDISDKFNVDEGLVIVKANKKSDYTIVCQGAANQVSGTTIRDFAQATHEYEAAVALQDTIKDMTGCSVKLVNDLKSPAKNPSTDDKVIVIGSTSRDSLYDIDYTKYVGDSFSVKAYGNNIVLSAALNPRTDENPYQDYDTADGIWNAVYYFVKEYLHYDPAVTMTTPKAKKGISVSITDYMYTDETPTPELKETSKKDGFDISEYGNLKYDDMMVHNAYRKKNSPTCYIQIMNSTSDYNVVLNKAKTKGALIFNTIDDCYFCDCADCKKAAEEEGTEMGAYFKFVRKIAADMGDAKLRILAANHTYNPPKTSLGNNVEVLIYNPKLCSAHPVSDAKCPTNAEFVKVVDGWKSVCGMVSILDFTSDYYYFPITFPNLYTMRENLAWYKTNNFYGVYLQIDTTQACLEFADLRIYLARVLLENPAMTEEEYSEHIDSGLAYYYGAENVKALREYIDAADALAHDGYYCFNIYSDPNDVLPMEAVVDGVVSYDTVFPKKAYALWESIHPYNETLARNESYLARMLSSRYQSSPASHAKTQYQEWMMSVVEMRDRSWVLNRILGSNK